jgi:hypothetical protein
MPIWIGVSVTPRAAPADSKSIAAKFWSWMMPALEGMDAPKEPFFQPLTRKKIPRQ